MIEENIGLIEKGALIGELGFITGNVREVGMKTSTISEFRIIEKKEFFELLNQFPQDRE